MDRALSSHSLTKTSNNFGLHSFNIKKVIAVNATQIEDRGAIFAIEKSYDNAWNQNEASILASFFTPDAVIINPHGEVAEGKNEFENLMSTLFRRRFKGSIHKSKILRIHFPKGDVAVVDGEATVTEISEHGESSITIVRFTDIMVKESDKWLIADTRAYVFLPDSQK